MWQTKYSLAIPKNLGVGVDFWQCSECDFRSPFTELKLTKLKFLINSNDLT